MSGIQRPSWHALFMRQAYQISTMSRDPRTKIGAVLVREKVPIVQGYNGLPRDLCDDESLHAERHERPVKYFYYEHAERNVFYFAAAEGIRTAGATLFTQGIPCADCARAVIQGCVKQIVVHKQWQDNELWIRQGKWNESCGHGKTMLEEAGVSITVFDGVLGTKTLMDGQVIEV